MSGSGKKDGEYRQMLEDAWKGSKDPYEPEKIPMMYARGFYAGLSTSVNFVMKDLTADLIGDLHKIRDRYEDVD